MKATIDNSKQYRNAKEMSDKKEMFKSLRLVVLMQDQSTGIGQLKVKAEARFYRSRSGDGASPIYCSLWLSYGEWSSGLGVAKGFGYHKTSLALARAFESAGIKLSEDISMRGDEVMVEAMLALGADFKSIMAVV